MTAQPAEHGAPVVDEARHSGTITTHAFSFWYGEKQALHDIDLRIPDLTDTPVGEHGERLVGHFLSRWDAGTLEGQVLLSLLRSAASDAAAAAGMRELFAHQLVPALRRLVTDESEVPQRAALPRRRRLALGL